MIDIFCVSSLVDWGRTGILALRSSVSNCFPAVQQNFGLQLRQLRDAPHNTPSARLGTHPVRGLGTPPASSHLPVSVPTGQKQVFLAILGVSQEVQKNVG